MERKWQAVNAAKVKEAMEGDDFIHKETFQDTPIYTFRRPGEFIDGRLIKIVNAGRRDRQGVAVLECVNDDGTIHNVAVRASKWLRSAFKVPGVYKMPIRITYIGSRATSYGHAQKIYLVEVDKGFITPQFQEVSNHGQSDKKPRSRKRIARPNGGKRLSATV